MNKANIKQLLFIIVLFCSNKALATDAARLAVSPIASPGEPVLFVDMTCMLCNDVVTKAKQNPELRNLRVVVVTALPPTEELMRSYMWHLSNSTEYGQSDLGCQFKCSTIASITNEPKRWQQTIGDDGMEFLRRTVLLGSNLRVLSLLAEKQGIQAAVPALLTDKIQLIGSYDELVLSLKGNMTNEQ